MIITTSHHFVQIVKLMTGVKKKNMWILRLRYERTKKFSNTYLTPLIMFLVLSIISFAETARGSIIFRKIFKNGRLQKNIIYIKKWKIKYLSLSLFIYLFFGFTLLFNQYLPSGNTHIKPNSCSENLKQFNRLCRLPFCLPR